MEPRYFSESREEPTSFIRLDNDYGFQDRLLPVLSLTRSRGQQVLLHLYARRDVKNYAVYHFARQYASGYFSRNPNRLDLARVRY